MRFSFQVCFVSFTLGFIVSGCIPLITKDDLSNFSISPLDSSGIILSEDVDSIRTSFIISSGGRFFNYIYPSPGDWIVADWESSKMLKPEIFIEGINVKGLKELKVPPKNGVQLDLRSKVVITPYIGKSNLTLTLFNREMNEEIASSSVDIIYNREDDWIRDWNMAGGDLRIIPPLNWDGMILQDSELIKFTAQITNPLSKDYYFSDDVFSLSTMSAHKQMWKLRENEFSLDKSELLIPIFLDPTRYSKYSGYGMFKTEFQLFFRNHEIDVEELDVIVIRDIPILADPSDFEVTAGNTIEVIYEVKNTTPIDFLAEDYDIEFEFIDNLGRFITKQSIPDEREIRAGNIRTFKYSFRVSNKMPFTEFFLIFRLNFKKGTLKLMDISNETEFVRVQ